MTNFVLDKKKLKKFGFNLLSISIGFFIFFSTFAYTAPFIIALILSFAIEPLIRFIVNKTKIPRNIASFMCVIMILVVLILMIIFLAAKLVTEAKDLFEILPSFFNNMVTMFSEFTKNGNSFVIDLPEEVVSFLNDTIQNLISSVATLANALIAQIFSTAVSIPSAIFFIFITVISTYFLSSDREKFIRFVKNQVPENWYSKIIFIKNDILHSVLQLIRAYMIIMSITFTEIFIGLTIIGVQYAFFIAVIIAVFDIMPVLGTGGIVIPWIVYSFVTDNSELGFSLLILYGIVVLVRQLLEPKIVGHQIGVHPLITLAAIYVGLKTIGAAGIILGPITFLVLRSIFEVVFKKQSLKTLLFSEKPTP
ncbi:MAG: sporulation integral membrane protein YtvI [Eubacteriaceae bacterium]|nr:sporulation integral membrane protein YtvI [Eubacteriaceae bacterium]